MWLPEDERRLLVEYVKEIGRVGDEEWFNTFEQLPRLLSKGKGFKNDDTAEDPVSQAGIGGEVAEGFDRINRVNDANNVLAARGLIALEHHGSDMNRVKITVTSEGYKWALKYRTRFGCADAFYMEHKYGILGLLISGMAGVVGGFISYAIIHSIFPK